MSYNMSIVKVKEEKVGEVLMVLDDSSSKRKFVIEEEKPEIISRSPIKFREFASVANMEASASKRPKLLANGRKVVKPEEKLATKKTVTAERKLVTAGKNLVTTQEKVVTEKAMVNIAGHCIHYQMSGGAFFLEKAAVMSVLKGKSVNGDIATERIGDVEFVSLKSFESAVKESGCDVAFKGSLLSRIVELDALNEEVLSTNSNVVVEKHSDENGGSVTRRPHRRRGDPRRRTVCSSVKVYGVDLGYRLVLQDFIFKTIIS